MSDARKLAEAYERVMRVRRLDVQITNSLNHPWVDFASDSIGEVIAVLNWRIYKIQGYDDRKFADVRECVFYRAINT